MVRTLPILYTGNFGAYNHNLTVAKNWSMTLVLTQLTSAGMAADSAITKIRNSKIIEVDQQG